MSLVLLTKPAVEPISLADLKHQCGYSPNEDTDHVKSEQLAVRLRRYIRTARADCENRTRRAFITQRWQLTLDRWPDRECREDRRGYPSIVPPAQPLQAVVSISYVDPAGETQVLDDSLYQVTPGGETSPGRICMKPHQGWPQIQPGPGAITIVYDAGYGDTGDDVPAAIQQAMIFLAHSYEDTTAYKNVDGLVDGLLSVYVNRVS